MRMGATWWVTLDIISDLKENPDLEKEDLRIAVHPVWSRHT